MGKIDFRKSDKELYSPSTSPSVIGVPKMNFVAVRGRGNPNEEGGEYQNAMALLYGICFTIKMSKMSGDTPQGYEDFVVGALEGLWDIDLSEISDFGVADKSKFEWISMIRLPEFVTEEVFEWAKDKLKLKKPELDLSAAFYLTYAEGLCVQVMHIGPYDDEPKTIAAMQEFVRDAGYVEDYDKKKYRYHHEIYLGDSRKAKPENLKTVIRHPIKKP
ncbi:MAG: GyrI-like domain-containing protein [Candidatus Saccharimonadales bacterium]